MFFFRIYAKFECDKEFDNPPKGEKATNIYFLKNTVCNIYFIVIVI